MRKGRNIFITCVLLPALVALLASCGSGSKDTDDQLSYSASELQLSTSARTKSGITDNILSFAWTETYGIDFYRLSVNPDGHSGFTYIENEDGEIDILPGEVSVDPDALPGCDDVADPDPGVNCLDLPPNCADVPDGVPFVNCQPVLILYHYEQLGLHLFSWPNALFKLEACTTEPAECVTLGMQSARELSAKAVDGLTTPFPGNQVSTTFGFSVAASEDGLQIAVGANTASIFTCEEVTYTDEILRDDEGVLLPCHKLRAIPDCDDLADPEAGVNCINYFDYCVDIPDGEPKEPGLDCIGDLPYCEDRTDPDPDVNCEIKPPFCIELDDPEAEECLDGLPDCDDRPDGEAGVDCRIIYDVEYCENLADGEPVPEECVVRQSIPNAGGVYIFGRDSNIDPWDLDTFLRSPNAGENDNFGWGVAMSDDGSTVVVSAPGEDGDIDSDPETNDNDNADSTGAAYIYTLDAGEWVYKDFLKADNGETNDLFGWDVELSGDGSIIAVSAPREAGADLVENEFLCEGAVYVFAHDGGDQWPQQQYLKALNPKQNDVFGQAVSLDYAGSVLAVGAAQDPDNDLLDEQMDEINGGVLFSGCDPEANPANNTGFVTIYERSGSSWSPVADLQASNADSGDRFGNSVAFNSDAGRLAVGATRENSLSRGLNGPDGNDLFGKGSGAAYLFERDAVSSNVWAQTQYLKASNTGLTDEFGSAVALSSSGESLVVGAWGEASPFPGINRSQEFNNAPGSGAIYVFREDTASLSWSQLAFVKAPGVRPGMGFGWDVELVQDGSVLVGAAPAFKTFGSVPGSVFIY